MLQKSSLLLPTILMTSMVRLPPFFCELVFAVPVSDCMLRHVPDLCLITGVYANLDTITITFDKNTDKAGLAEGVVQTRATVDALFAFDMVVQFFVATRKPNPILKAANHEGDHEVSEEVQQAMAEVARAARVKKNFILRVSIT